jgi:hypothetical protein
MSQHVPKAVVSLIALKTELDNALYDPHSRGGDDKSQRARRNRFQSAKVDEMIGYLMKTEFEVKRETQDV